MFGWTIKYSNEAINIIADAIVNLYVFIVSNNELLYSPTYLGSSSYNLPITYEPIKVEMSNTIGTYPEYCLNPMSTKNYGVHNS